MYDVTFTETFKSLLLALCGTFWSLHWGWWAGGIKPCHNLFQ